MNNPSHKVYGWWIGVVVDVKDPFESGRVKIRAYGLHDDKVNIPDSSLPWALTVQSVDSAAIGKIGTAAVGLVVGSRVIGFWADADHQLPIVWGSIGKAGDPIAGQLEFGAPKVDPLLGSAPARSKGSMQYPNNPYTYLFGSRTPISSIDSGAANIFSVSDTTGVNTSTAVMKDMRFATNPTIGNQSPNNNCPISKMLSQIDPLGINSSLKCLPSAFDLLKALLDLATNLSKAFIGMIAAAIRNAILKLMQKLGLQKVLTILNQVAQTIGNVKGLLDQLLAQACGINAITMVVFNTVDMALATAMNAINTAAGIIYSFPAAVANLSGDAASALLNSVVTYPLASIATAFTAAPPSVSTAAPSNYVRKYSSSDQYPGYIVWVDPNGSGAPVYTPRNGEPNFISASQHSSYVMENAILGPLEAGILSGNLTGATFSTMLSNAAQAGKALAVSMLLGAGFNLAAGLASSATSVPAIANDLVNDNIMIASAASVVPDATRAVNKFIQNQALAVQKSIRMRMMVSNTPVLPGSCTI